MTDENSTRDDLERELDAIIAAYYRAVEAGECVDQKDFIAKHPEVARELSEFFADLGMLAAASPQNYEDPALDATITPKASPQSKAAPGSVVRYFGAYEILEELGAGGMGVVYKARHARLRKIVALKMIRAGELATEFEVKMFEAEARAAAKLDHPNIVAVHEVGAHSGRHFYSMDYVAGGSLSKLHRDEPVAARHAAELVKQLAEAIDYAHGMGIVHRDLKPANILLTSDGVPRITDFGLAKRLWADEDSIALSATETGQILGTAGYMSPEQAEGKTKLVGPPADIYALGAVLYALLTRLAPFIGESQADTIRQVIDREPVSPRVLNPALPRDLETICLKCLNKERHERYGTAQLLADDLKRFLDGRSVQARPISRPAQVWRWCRRNSIVASLGAAILLLLVVVGIGGSIGTIVFHNVFRREQSARREIDKEYISHLFEISTTKAEQEPMVGIVSLAETLVKAKGMDLPEQDGRIRLHLGAWMRGYSPPVAIRQDFSGYNFDISPDSKTIVTYSRDGGTSTTSGCIQGFDAITGELKWEQVVVGYPSYSKYSPDGKHILTVRCHWPTGTPQVESVQAMVDIRDASNGEVVDLVTDAILQVSWLRNHLNIQAAYSPDGCFIGVYGGQPGVRVWDCKDQRFVVDEPVDAQITDMSFSPQSSFLVRQIKPAAAKGNGPYSTQVFNTTTWASVDSEWAKIPESRAISLSKDERYVCVETDLQLAVFDRTANTWLPERFELGQGKTADVKFGDDEPQLTLQLTSLQSNVVKSAVVKSAIVWNPRTGMRLPFDRTIGNRRGFQMKEIQIGDPFSITDDGQVLANGEHFSVSGMDLRIVRICGMTTGVPQGRAFLTRSALSLSRDGQMLAVQDPFSLNLWNLAAVQFKNGRSPKVRQELAAEAAAAERLLIAVDFLDKVPSSELLRLGIYSLAVPLDRSLSISSDGEVVAVSGGGMGLSIFESGVPNAASALPFADKTITAVMFNPKGNLLAIGGGNGIPIYLYDYRSSTIVQELNNGKDWISCLAFSSDGHAIAAGSHFGGRVRVWSLAEGRLEHTWDAPSDILAVDFGPTNDLVAAGTESSRLFVWSRRTGELLWSGDHKLGGPINSVRFSPDGFTIATAANGAIQLWEAASGKKLGSAITAVRMKWTDCAGAIRFSDSGKFVYFITAEGKFWEWKMPSAIQGDAEAILNYAELSTNLKLDNRGNPVLLSPAEIKERSDRVGSFTP